MFELVIVWLWHAPAPHQVARTQSWALALEQTSFLVASLWLWTAALDASDARTGRGSAGVVSLLFTSMHMTLLGALFALANRPLFQHAQAGAGLSAVADQQLGGVIMLLVGGASYLIGGLWLTGAALVPASAAVHRRKETKS
jgi:putative membrane protein